MSNKVCTKCKVEKPLESFNRSQSSKDGLTHWCRNCAAAYNASYKEKNKDKGREVSVKTNTCLKCGQTKPAGEFYKHKGKKNGLDNRCKECVLKRWKSLSFPVSVEEKKCSVCGFVKSADCFNKDKTKTTGLESHCRECQSRYNAATRETRNQKNLQKLKTDVGYRLAHLLRGRLRIALAQNYKTGSAVRDLGCSIPDLRAHLESLFEPAMTWGNYGIGKGKWHIDHIMPLSAFDLTNRQHFLLACHYLNLQPLWGEENIAKHDKIPDVGLLP